MASSLNKAMIIGNLTRDPELRQTSTGRPVCSFSVATNRYWKNAQGERQEQAEYHDIVAWGKLAEICAKYMHKGKKVYVDGRLQTRDWEGKDGVRRYRTEIVADNVILLGRPGSGSGGGGSFSDKGSKTSDSAPNTPNVQDESSANPDDEIKIEDIPF